MARASKTWPTRWATSTRTSPGPFTGSKSPIPWPEHQQRWTAPWPQGARSRDWLPGLAPRTMQQGSDQARRYDDDLRFAHVLADNADDITTRRFRALDLRVDTKPDLTPVSDA